MLKKIFLFCILSVFVYSFDHDAGFGGVYLNYSLSLDHDAHIYELGAHYDLPFYPIDRTTTYLQLGFANWNISNNLQVVNVAPVLRYYPHTHSSWLHPYLDLSIGLAYFSKKDFGEYNFSSGIRMQDTITYGFSFGDEFQYDFGIGYTYYNKAGFSSGSGHIKIFPRVFFGYNF